MSQSSLPSPSVRFAQFELDSRAGELRKDSHRIKLQEQPLQILAMLLEHPGEVVTREELHQKLWPADTFVDFDHGLNSAVARLREALNDSAQRPKYIETVARRGYRFIGELEGANNRQATARELSRQEEPRETERPLALAPGAQSRAKEPIVRRLVLTLAGVVLLACTTWYFTSGRVDSSLLPPRVVPLTSLPDRARNPAFSPDGNYVAFARYSKSPELSGIFIKQVGGDHLLQLTKNEQDFGFCCPAWSPDGRYIAFSRFTKEEHGISHGIYIVSAIGGAARKLFAGVPAHPPLDWSPDGRFIAFTAKEPDAKETYSLLLLSVETLETRKLSEPPAENQDWGPAFSPDGKQLAFVRQNIDSLGDIFIMPANGGEPRRLTFDHAAIPTSPVWTRDGRSLVFSSTRSSIPTLWRTSANGGSPVQVPQVGVVTTNPAISPKGHRLAYEQILGSSSIWSLNLGNTAGKDSNTQVTSSKGYNRAPEFSPDGSKIAFESDRTGTMEIWTCKNDGSDLMRLTNFGAVQFTGPPRWSPDGQKIAFGSALGEHNAIFVVNAEGGVPRPLTHGVSDSLSPSWSRDGKWIYFSSMRSGEWQIWRMSSEGGEPVQVTKQGGRTGFESADGQFLYYAKTPEREIWRMPLAGGQESPLSPRIHVEHWSGWTVTDKGIYFLGEEESSPHPVLKFFDFSSHRIVDVANLKKPVPWRSWISASADGKFLLYPQLDQEESNIMLLENFR
jgi:Tol biopolymer transport system component/DNA-binding winged helix-turn-helix (wHTH) protein